MRCSGAARPSAASRPAIPREAGFCLTPPPACAATSAIAVVVGAPSEGGSADDNQALLNYGFRFFETQKLYPLALAEAEANGRSAAAYLYPSASPGRC